MTHQELKNKISSLQKYLNEDGIISELGVDPSKVKSTNVARSDNLSLTAQNPAIPPQLEKIPNPSGNYVINGKVYVKDTFATQTPSWREKSGTFVPNSLKQTIQSSKDNPNVIYDDNKNIVNIPKDSDGNEPNTTNNSFLSTDPKTGKLTIDIDDRSQIVPVNTPSQSTKPQPVNPSPGKVQQPRQKTQGSTKPKLPPIDLISKSMGATDPTSFPQNQPTQYEPGQRRNRPAQQTKPNPAPPQDLPRIGWNDMNENTMLERMLQLAKRNVKLDEAGQLTSDIYSIPSGPDRQAAAAEQEKINKGQLPNSSVLATLRTKYNYSPKNYSVTPNSGNINYGPTAPVKEFPEIPANDQEGLSIVKPYVTTFKTTGNVNVVPQHAALIKNKYGVDIAQRLKNPVQAAPTGSAKTVPTPGTAPQNTINQSPKQAADILGAKKFESTTYREDPILARIVELSRAK